MFNVRLLDHYVYYYFPNVLYLVFYPFVVSDSLSSHRPHINAQNKRISVVINVQHGDVHVVRPPAPFLLKFNSDKRFTKMITLEEVISIPADGGGVATAIVCCH